MAKQFTTEQLKETVKELLKFTKSIAPQLSAIAKDREFELVITNDENGIGMSCSMGWDQKDDWDGEVIEDPNFSPAKADEEMKENIISALQNSKGNRREAAALLGISERTLSRKMKEYGIKS